MLILLKEQLALTTNYFSVASFPSDVLGSFTRILNKGFGSKEGKSQVCSGTIASGAVDQGTMGQWWQLCQQFCNNIHTKHPEDTNFLLCQLCLHILKHLSGLGNGNMACTNLPTTERSPGFHITSIVRWARVASPATEAVEPDYVWHDGLRGTGIYDGIKIWSVFTLPGGGALTAGTMKYGRNLYLVQLWPAQSQVGSHPHEPRHSSLCGHTDKKRFIEISFLAPK